MPIRFVGHRSLAQHRVPVESGLCCDPLDAGPDDLAGYKVERSPVSSDTWTVLVSLVRDTEYHDASGAAGMRYRLTGINGLGEELLLGETMLTPQAVLAAWPLPYRGGDHVDCDISFAEIAPRSFSFNSPHGACPRCSGLGTTSEFDPARMVPDITRSLAGGAVAAWGRRQRPRYYDRLLAALASQYEIDLDTPWQDLPERAHGPVYSDFGYSSDAVKLEPGVAGYEPSVAC